MNRSDRARSVFVHRVLDHVEMNALHPLDAVGSLLVDGHEGTIAAVLVRPEVRSRCSVFLEDLDLGHNAGLSR